MSFNYFRNSLNNGAPFSGHSFLTLNDELLELYSKCASSKEILEVQQKYLEDTEKTREENRNSRDDFWPTSSESESESDEEEAHTSNAKT